MSLKEMVMKMLENNMTDVNNQSNKPPGFFHEPNWDMIGVIIVSLVSLFVTSEDTGKWLAYEMIDLFGAKNDLIVQYRGHLMILNFFICSAFLLLFTRDNRFQVAGQIIGLCLMLFNVVKLADKLGDEKIEIFIYAIDILVFLFLQLLIFRTWFPNEMSKLGKESSDRIGNLYLVNRFFFLSSFMILGLVIGGVYKVVVDVVLVPGIEAWTKIDIGDHAAFSVAGAGVIVPIAVLQIMFANPDQILRADLSWARPQVSKNWRWWAYWISTILNGLLGIYAIKPGMKWANSLTLELGNQWVHGLRL